MIRRARQLLTVLGSSLLLSTSAPGQPDDNLDAPKPPPREVFEALQAMVRAQRSGDLQAYAATLAEPVGPVFLRYVDAAGAVGKAKQALLSAFDERFGKSGAIDRFDYATDDAQQRAILQRLVDVRVDATAPTGDQFKLNVTTTVRMPDGGVREIPQGFEALRQNGSWKIQDMAIVNHLAAQRKLADTDWEIAGGFEQLARDVAAGKVASRELGNQRARLIYDQATGGNVPPPAGREEFLKGVALYKAGDHAEAFKHFLSAAEAGYDKAQCQVAIQLSGGLGVAEDVPKAVGWYRKSADGGNAVAENDLGSMLLDGEGVPKNTAEGMRLLLASAGQDNPQACTNIGRAFALGIGVPRDQGQALGWYLKAANLGDDQAAYFYKWLRANPGNRTFIDEHQVQVYNQLILLRASAFNVMLGGTDLGGVWHPGNPQRAAQMRADADRLAAENGLD